MEYYTGRSIGRIFEEVLRAREAYIISPWIQGRYAVELAKAVREGRAHVITSLDESNEFIRQIGIRQVDVKRPIIGALTSLIGIYTIIRGLSVIGIGIIIIGIYITLTSIRPRPRSELNNRIRLSPKIGNNGFIHIKLYIADGQAWIGSANMTPSAIHNNIEILVPIPRELALEIFNYAWARAKPWP